MAFTIVLVGGLVWIECLGGDAPVVKTVHPADVQILNIGAADLPDSCGYGGELSATDGRASRWSFLAHTGSTAGALDSIKKLAAKRGFNLVVIDPDKTTDHIGVEVIAAMVTVYGTGYVCDSRPVP